jgi:hypothetical protein
MILKVSLLSSQIRSLNDLVVDEVRDGMLTVTGIIGTWKPAGSHIEPKEE